ncbi:hypothetical protein GCM10022384_36180 [Streptomyces marokkonensis]|uniref:Uncharacterized protein n=1 Tax=Streptomyces marokkonensis TaxID=324855 RepID=A0ABP7QLW1_9ACTN
MPHAECRVPLHSSFRWSSLLSSLLSSLDLFAGAAVYAAIQSSTPASSFRFTFSGAADPRTD